MTVLERLHADGRRLFVRRSLVPIALLPVLILSFPESLDTELRMGRSWSLASQWMALAIALAGIATRAITVAVAPDGNSSRETRHLRAASLTTTGVYSLVRHPLYVGNGLMWLGVAASTSVWWLVLITALAYWLYVERIMLVEETYLEHLFGDGFRRWAARTPAFLPKFSAWQRPAGAFSWRRLLSEHNGLLTVAVAVLAIEVLQDVFYAGDSLATFAGDHRDLIAVVLAATLISLVCIAIRRWPVRGSRHAAVLP